LQAQSNSLWKKSPSSAFFIGPTKERANLLLFEVILALRSLLPFTFCYPLGRLIRRTGLPSPVNAPTLLRGLSSVRELLTSSVACQLGPTLKRPQWCSGDEFDSRDPKAIWCLYNLQIKPAWRARLPRRTSLLTSRLAVSFRFAGRGELIWRLDAYDQPCMLL